MIFSQPRLILKHNLLKNKYKKYFLIDKFYK